MFSSESLQDIEGLERKGSNVRQFNCDCPTGLPVKVTNRDEVQYTCEHAGVGLLL